VTTPTAHTPPTSPGTDESASEPQPSTEPVKIDHPSQADRSAAGKAARARAPLSGQAAFDTDGRADPIALLETQAASRVPDLVPIRYGRMSSSAFAFYRGAALIMAADLAKSPNSGLAVQLCGDAHMSNFGTYASPERRLVFDINDFDETHPGPFEWDLKRLAASLAVAGRENGYSTKKRRRIVLSAATGYREAMRSFAKQGNLAVWYSHADLADMMDEIGSALDSRRRATTQLALDKARSRDSVQALAKLTTIVDGRARIVSQPPLIVPFEELLEGQAIEDAYANLRHLIRSYRRTLQFDRRHLLEEFKLVQMARKVVGVGSVGTRAWILLFEGLNGQDPLFLQAKEAQASVLSSYTRATRIRNQGQRVVVGQQLMQASSDIFLGWQRAAGLDGIERDFYIRQLRDGKGSVVVETMLPDGMAFYARVCGQALARAHARSGDRVAIGSYLGATTAFDEAIADFAETCADQNERDHGALTAAIASGRVTAQTGL